MKEETLRFYRERILQVLLHIQRHLDEELPLAELARVACLSPYHFHRVFRGMVGESVAEHVRRLRIERAALQLKHTRYPVTRVAFDAGYESHEAFTRAFKGAFGESPSQYRRNRGALAFMNAPSGVHFDPRGEAIQFQPEAGRQNDMKASIKRVEPIRVAFARHVGPYKECKNAWEKICGWAGPKGLLRPGVQFIGICHDDPEVTPAEKIRYDACITIDKNFLGDGEIGVQIISGGDYAVATHKGSYDNLIETYAVLCGQWIPAQGRQMRSEPSFEVYLNSPDETAPKDLLTDVYVPLESK